MQRVTNQLIYETTGINVESYQAKAKNPEYVYVATAGPDYCKIGRSRNPEARVRQLNTGSPIPVTLAFKWPACKWARQEEQHLHKVFKTLGKHAHGEWFHTTPYDVFYMIYQGYWQEIELAKEADD